MGRALEAPENPTTRQRIELFEAAVDASSEGLALAEEGVICYANLAFARLLGLSNPSQVIGRPLASLRPAGYPCVRLRGREGNCGRSHLCQFTAERDGKTSRIESTCSPFQVQDREMLFVTIRDVSIRDRRRMVRDEDRRFRTIFNGAPTAIVQCNLAGRVLEANSAAERMLGYTRTELRGMHFAQFTHPDDIEKATEPFQELAQGRTESCELELRYLNKSSGTGWVQLAMSLVRGVTREPQFVIGMAEDITQRKLAEQRLREAQKMEVIGRLVSGFAHDFNNLLTGITLYCDLLLAGLDANSRLRHHAEEIRLAGEQGATLIQQLLAISRKQVIEPKVLSLNDVIRSTHGLLSRLIGDKFQLSANLKPSLAYVRIDPAQAQQLLFNLVLNARDAMAEGGQIAIATDDCEFVATGTAIPGVAFSVTDCGCGMSEEVRAHLFEPFFTTKSSGRGTGLGLATVHDIVSRNGGTIEIDTEVGKGSRLTIKLPRALEAVGETIPPVEAFPGKGGEIILLVEDNSTVREAAAGILRESGYRVLEAGSGAEAIELSEQSKRPIDLLLADIAMPGMSGRELAQQLEQQRPGLAVLHMTGFDPVREDSSGSAPVISFRKPFTGAVLLEKVREILDARSSRTYKTLRLRKREKS